MAVEALRWLRRTIRYDLDEKWRWEVSREIHRLDQQVKSDDSSGEKEKQAEPASA